MGDAAFIGRAARRELSTVIKKVVGLALDNLVNSNPVDTEHSRSNWVVSVGRPYTGVDGSRESVSYAAQEHGRDVLANYDVGRDGPIFLRNNVHYEKYLDEGSSQQAPPGWVAMAILAAQRLAPQGRKGSVRRMLTAMARQAIERRAGFGSRTAR